MNTNVSYLHSLRIEVLPGYGVPIEARPSYVAAYETWREVWKQTLLEVDGQDKLSSDHFSRQDYIVSIFHGSKCVALCCFRRADLSLFGDREDSWFQPWPSNLLEELGANYQRGLVVSWLTIHPDYRRTFSNETLKNFNASERLCEAINFFIQDSNVEIAYGITRNHRSVNQMAKYTGFLTIKSGAIHHGEEADLITTNHRQLKEAEKSYPSFAFESWNKRKVYLTETLELFSQQAGNTGRKRAV